jgi:SAM-dependent methyltransferase
MSESASSGQRAQTFFEELWRRGDPWELESSDFERARHSHQLGLLAGRRYARALEIGCGAGCFTRLLSRVADHVVALDIAPAAIERARAPESGSSNVDYRVANIMECDLSTEGPWDLIVMSEIIYYLGWLYSFFDVAWLAAELYSATLPGGRLLLANTHGGVDDGLLRPWVIRTYHNLFLNVGYQLETEQVFRGTKNSVDIEVLASIFAKAQDERLT